MAGLSMTFPRNVKLTMICVISVVLDPCYVPGYRNFDVCFLGFFCALESSCLGRLSAIKVQLELESDL